MIWCQCAFCKSQYKNRLLYDSLKRLTRREQTYLLYCYAQKDRGASYGQPVTGDAGMVWIRLNGLLDRMNEFT